MFTHQSKFQRSIKPLAVLCLFVILTGCATTSQNETPVADTSSGKQLSKAEKKGQHYLANYYYGDAYQIYDGLAKKDPENLSYRLGLAESQYGLGKLDGAYTLFTELVSDETYRVRGMQGLALIESMRGNFELAKELFLTILAEDETLWRSWNGLARCYDFSGDWDKSIEAYEASLKYTKDTAVIQNNIALSLMAQERYDEANIFLDEALKQRPDFEILYINKRIGLALAKRYDEATIGADEEESAKLLNNAGYVALLQRDYRTAEELFNRSIEVSPSFYSAAFQNLQILEKLRAKYGV